MVFIGKLGKFVRVNLVFVIAVLAAIITSFIVVPDKEYLGYFDFRTLTCLFCTLAVVGALGNIGFSTPWPRTSSAALPRCARRSWC